MIFCFRILFSCGRTHFRILISCCCCWHTICEMPYLSLDLLSSVLSTEPACERTGRREGDSKIQLQLDRSLASSKLGPFLMLCSTNDYLAPFDVINKFALMIAYARNVDPSSRMWHRNHFIALYRGGLHSKRHNFVKPADEAIDLLDFCPWTGGFSSGSIVYKV